ncbi:UDP-glucuronate 4-epimerase [Carnobacterium alterfunditum]|uniref:UDP-glucuronate 4-epimerase n=2 Tax=Carnobacterium alterfunditum TaxID=28230 RepID=A0A1N6HJF9_9LACT|nr:GDP-mannose 4,6-dehydratase [Carnobacterium alterfunditum]SIO19819.1 UDP-glucuronate 4-epimerase [Carnobacterium alterfunditum]
MMTKSTKDIILVTGVAGFIGSFLAKRLLESGKKVIGIDNLNDYYDVNLKKERLENLNTFENFKFEKVDIADKESVMKIFIEFNPSIVINLAAQAGVRYSLENPDAYTQSNLIGFFNILEACRNHPVDHLIYASSSSVYGNNKKVPFEETDKVDNPVSLYAATKKSNELMAHTYSHLYNIPATGLRFFTVYGPMGRPDMAYFGFADKYFANDLITIYNNGDFENDLYRDFTYIDDIIEGIVQLLLKQPEKTNEQVPHRILNIGNSQPVKLMEFITTLEKAFSQSLGRTVKFNKKYEPIKLGDVPATYASTDKLQELTGFKPTTSIKEGLQKFTDWYVNYYKKN